MRKIFLFTATYPHSTAETFLEDEIKFIADGFDEVVIQPLACQTSEKDRIVPEKCVVNNGIITNKFLQYIKLFIPTRAYSIYIKDFFAKRVFLNKARLKTWLVSFSIANNLLLSSEIKHIFKNISTNDICYFYWGKGANVLAHFFKGKAKFVSRFHGEWDLWEESCGNYAPIRKQINSALEKAIFISKKGLVYYDKKYPNLEKVVCRLGSCDSGVTKKSNDGVVRIVSCSSVYPLKRVDLIFESLYKAADLNIEWTHLGGGRDFEKLQELVRAKNRDGLKVNLVGQVKHDDVMKFYQNNPIDMFVNLSTNEGIPVSIMEAISFNIPAIATNVGASSEVVTKESGVLVSANPTTREVVDAIKKILDNPKVFAPREFWKNNYNADTNYSELVKILYSL